MDLQDIFQARNLLLALVINLLTQFVRVSTGTWDKTRTGKRLLPLLPLVISLCLTMAGASTARTTLDRFMAGVVLAAISTVVYKLLRTTAFGRGIADALEQRSESVTVTHTVSTQLVDPKDVPATPAPTPIEPNPPEAPKS